MTTELHLDSSSAPIREEADHRACDRVRRGIGAPSMSSRIESQEACRRNMRAELAAADRAVKLTGMSSAAKVW